ncbi:RNA polymerase sigma factor [Phytohabitans aurantiacus]|nr:sigma factor-like helix-turn-helix DNA-binding protein [Phytohabitans aurantiacus]
MPSSDIQQARGTGHGFDLPEFDPTLAYEKEIRDGRLRGLSSSVHPSATKAPRQGESGFRAGDQQLVEHLAKNNFAGPEYDLVAERLVKTGYRYCLSWLKSGKMHRKCRDAGRPVGEFPEGIDREVFKDLATDAAVEGAVLFRRVALLENKWQPDGGASLLTYYVGACIQVYPTIYRRWYREHRRQWMTDPYDVMPEHVMPNQSEYVELRNLLERGLDEATWVALKMKAEGSSYAEIAEVLGRSVKAVENLLRRGRQRAAELIKGAGDDHV